PSDSIYHVGSLDPAMLSRCLKVNLAVDVDEWIKYAYENKLDDRIIQFISVNRDLLCRPKAQEPCPLPRTWKLLSDIIKVIPEDISFDIISGLVGKEAAVTFQKFCDSEYKKPVSGKDILNRYKNVKEKLESQRNDETWVTVRDLLAVIGNSKLNKEQFNNLKQFLLDTKAEWKVEIITKLNDELLAKLAKTELVDDIAHIISQASKITKNK
ncbi:MAG: hypothetical protein QXP60_05665, partial [Nitrososphaerota archaeon]